MPKKAWRHATQHIRESSASSAPASGLPVSAKKTEKRNHRSVHIGLKNGRRWVSLKKRLGLSTDDDLVVYLLDLADSITKQRENSHETEAWEVEHRQEKSFIDSEGNIEEELLKDLPRRSLRKHATYSDESAKNENEDIKRAEKLSLYPNEVEKLQHSKSSKVNKSKRHKSKGRHHKEKRKKEKRKHQKIKSHKDLSFAENKIKKDDPWKFDSESEAEKVCSELQNNFISQTVSQLSKDLDSLESNKIDIHKSCQNKSKEIFSDGKKTDISIDKNVNETLTQKQKDSNMVQNHSKKAVEVQTKVDESNKFLDTNQLTHVHSKISLVDQKNIDNAHIAQDNLNKKNKRSKYETRENSDITVEDSRNDCDQIVALTYKKDTKKHKDHQVKKFRDVRKAPQDGIIITEMNQENIGFDNSTNVAVTTTSVSDIDSLPSEAINENTGTETPRLAIKIKLCQECNSRHLQDTCPLSEPVLIIKDSVTLDEWIHKHSKNSEIMKIFNTNDPMCPGYRKSADDGFESDDEVSEQLQSKQKIESEEKQLIIDCNKPIFARDSLPDCLELKLTNTEHGIGVFVKEIIPMYTQLGPLIGKSIQEMDIPDDFSMRHIWEIEVNNKTTFISSTNPLTSNWIRYVRPAETKEERNVAVIYKKQELNLVTCKNLSPGTELTYWSDSQSTAWTRKNKIDKTNCGGCNLNFSHPIYYRLHCCIFHDTNYSLTIRKYHCKVCGAAVLGKDNIMKHAAQLHAGRGAYQCQYCKKFFLRLNYLEMHRTYGCSQNPQRSRPLCDFCGRKFCQPQKLKVHIKRMHSDMSEVLREFQCKLCLKLLGSRAALQRHMKEVHHKDVVGAATCDRCGKMFQNKSNLKIHMLTHSGVKPFKCKENGCKAAFTTKQCLQFHYKKVHGLTEEMMPKIERSVAYTFDAYSGGLVEDTGRGKTPKFNSGDTDGTQENSDSLNSFDDCSNENNDSLLVVKPPENFSSTSSSSKQINSNEEAIPQMSMTETLPESPVESPESDVDLYGTSQMPISKSSSNKKWMTEFDMHPNSSTPPPVTTAADIYDFQDRVSEMEVRREEDKIQSNSQSLIDDSKLSIGMYRRTESSNASLLVEAALDAAEREIGAVSSPILEDSDREANLYSISNEIDFKSTCAQNQVIHRSPNEQLDTYMQEELTVSPTTTPHTRHTPSNHMIDYHIHRPIDYINVPGIRTSHSIEQYLDQQDLQRVIHVSQDVNSSPSRYQEISHHHHSLHHHHQHHQIASDNLSSDEGDSVAQNLSLTVKEKSLQQIELSKYDGLESDFSLINRDRMRFEPLIVQSEDQGLDMSARGLQQAFGSQNHHHHHHLYEISERERQGVDLSRTSVACMSPPHSYPPPYPPPYPHVDVPRVVSLESGSRPHHLHTSVSRIIASPQPASSITSHIGSESLETRILSPPPPTMATYNTTYPVGPTPYHTSRPGYHYSGYY